MESPYKIEEVLIKVNDIKKCMCCGQISNKIILILLGVDEDVYVCKTCILNYLNDY